MRYEIVDTGSSRSFPETHPFIDGATADGEVLVILGAGSAQAFAALGDTGRRAAVLIELGTECLGVHTGESRAEEGSNVIGFSRFRLGQAAPGNLVELVRQPRTDEAALAAAKAVFESAGLVVATCGDFAGRIVDRLVRPYFNAALRRLDEGLATAGDLDTTLRLGLGYPKGPIELLEATGLAEHCAVTEALYEAYGDAAYLPARRACVAQQRAERGSPAAPPKSPQR